jgi:hypothetical protein
MSSVQTLFSHLEPLATACFRKLLQGASLETVRQKMRFALLEDLVAVYGSLLKGKNFLPHFVKDYCGICWEGGVG